MPAPNKTDADALARLVGFFSSRGDHELADRMSNRFLWHADQELGDEPLETSVEVMAEDDDGDE